MSDGSSVSLPERPLRIAYVLGGLPFGGIEKWMLDLSLEFRRNGLVTPRVFNLSGTGSLLPEFLRQKVDVCNVGKGKHAISSHRLDTALALRGKLREFAPDLIHTVHFSANHLGRIASLGMGIPVITHLRNTKHEKRLGRRFSDKLLSYATTRYLAVSKAVAGVVQTDHNLAKRPVDVLYNAIDTSRFSLEAIDLKAEYGIDGPVVLSVGRYVPQKNYDLLIRAVGILRDQGIAVSLVLVGEGSERDRLETLRAELGLEGRVVLTGFREDVAAFYKASDIFASPSSFEGFLISQLEAMYCGLPCVVSRHVPLLELASEASLVCDTTAEDIAVKIRALLTDSELYAKLAHAAPRIAKPHTMQQYAEVLHEYYRAVLGEKGFGSIQSALWHGAES